MVLIEGQIEITRNSDTVQMAIPQTIFNAPHAQAAAPVTTVNADDLGRWAAETEPQNGQGVCAADGHWQLVVSSYRRTARAAQFQSQLLAAGFAATTAPTTLRGVRCTG